ncbi:tyrosine-protein phosphatase [Myxococcota bacterium]|nr:tyrosine-protein phosphatase [Myxococcota bacterium]
MDRQMSNQFERKLDVKGTFNFRDVGRYPARDGHTTRSGVLYRSGALHDLEPVGALGIRTVIDLRGEADVERDAGPLGGVQEQAGVRRVALPLIPTTVGDLTGHQHLNDRYGPGISADRYGGYLEIGSDNLRRVFQLFRDPEAFPAVIHCTAGKDRTGVTIALVLDLLGVPPETIVADYEMSNAAMPDLIAHLRGEPAQAVDLSESDLARFGAPRQAMVGFLEQVHREHGSARKLLATIGVEPEVMKTLEDVLLEPVSS